MKKENTSDLQNLIQQTEMLKVKLEMETMFKKNMSFFEKINPTIFEKFNGYKAKKIWPIFSEEGYVTLFDSDKEEPIYPGDPHKYVKDAMEHYEKYSYYKDFTFNAQQELPDTEDRSHVIHISKLVNLSNEYQSKRESYLPLPKNIRFMLMKGIGLGYQLDELLSKTDLRFLCIVESNPDIFFASLHTLDYDKLFSWFNRRGYGINLIVDLDPEQCMRNVLNYMIQIGTYNSVRVYEFDHLCSKELEKACDGIHRGLREAISSLGFFDDERVGLAHSVKNFQNKYQLLESTKSSYDIPVFICGNGPSLDKAKEVLLKYQGKVIIVSSGSCLGALYKMGIKPDFHIENERVHSIYPWIKSSSPREFRKDIQLITLNVVHPKVLNEFDNVALVLKANDLGSTYFKTYDKKDKYPYLLHCNPTVTNTSMAIMLKLGFKNIYLFGVDLGFAPDGQHHSSYSQYNEVDSKLYEGKDIYDIKAKTNLYAKGNFINTVITSPSFRNSRDAFNELISTYSDINVFNCGEGVYIEGSTPLKCEDVDLKDIPLNKDKIKATVMKKSFDNDYFCEEFNDDRVLTNMEPVQMYLESVKELISKVSDDVEKNYDILNQVDFLLKILISDKQHIYRYFLLKGSIYTHMIVLALSLESNFSSGIEEFKKGMQIFSDFIDDIIDITKNKMLETDHYEHDIANALVEK